MRQRRLKAVEVIPTPRELRILAPHSSLRISHFVYSYNNEGIIRLRFCVNTSTGSEK